MNISLNWLTDYVDVTMGGDELGRLFTYIGLNCEEVAATSTDVVFDLEVTSNRPDCLGHLGVARELAAATGAAFRPPSVGQLPTSGKAEDYASVTVTAADLCPRYTARVLRGVKVGPSPGWLVERLEAIGMRSINNVVDITNYVLMEYSQPLHSFDLDKLAGSQIIVRRAVGGEELIVIDQTRCRLDESMLIIADADRPVAVAGVMGAVNTEVGEGTTNVLIESAQFDPLSVRRTSRKLALMSESNYRFERGVDPVGVAAASLRACALIGDLAGGELAEGMIDAWDQPFSSSELSLRPGRTEALLGVKIPVDRQVELLDGLGLSPKLADGAIVCTIPSHRADLRREADLIEEVARLEGYDKIPAASRVTHAVTSPSPSQHLRRQVGQLLTAAGYDEAITFSFIDDREAELFGQTDPVHVDASVRRSNNALRTTVIPSLLRACKTNQDAGNAEVSLFELAAVFPPDENSQLPDEYVELGLVTTGELRELRGVLAELVARTAPDAALETAPAAGGALDDATAAVVRIDGANAGVIGRISRQVQDYYSLERDVHAATIRFDALLSHAGNTRRYRSVPKFPPARRDLSLIVDDAVTWRHIADVVAGVDQPMRVAFDYVTTYRGKPVPTGRKSVTLRLVYRSDTQTLRNEEVDGQVQDIVSAMTKDLAAELR